MADGVLQRSGTFVAVVGPSGAGKDSLIGYARERLAGDPGFVFVRRIVTREADAALEDHDSWTPDRFARAEAEGLFALSWQAHGLGYGLPGEIDVNIAAGRVVVANISRRSVDDARARFANCRIISVTAPREVLAERLAARGRESLSEVEARLERPDRPISGTEICEIENAGRLSDAGDVFIQILKTLSLSY